MMIKPYSYEGEGLLRIYENEQWTVGIKNWKPSSGLDGMNNLERHNETHELFVLLAGKCTLVYANEVHGNLDMQAISMQPFQVYDIPPSLWHNAVMDTDTKMVLIEDSSTSMENSDLLLLTAEQLTKVKELVEKS